MKHSDRLEAISILEDLLILAGCANANLSRFDGSYLMTNSDLSTYRGDTCYMGATPSDFYGPLDMRFIGHPEHDGGMATFYRTATASGLQKSSFRSAFASFNHASLTHLLVQEWIEFNRNGSVLCNDFVYVACRGDHLTVQDPSPMFVPSPKKNGVKPPPSVVRHPTRDRQILLNAKLALGVAFCEPTFWIAKVRIESDMPAIALITDPSGIKDLWKFRDIPSGAKRRSALLHWVSNHWRAVKNDPEVEVYVRKQLRGQRTFSYGDMTIDITESKEDAARISKLIDERTAMRKEKTDRRRRPVIQ